MRIVCPHCGAAYDVPDAVAVARRTVRCARCATEFQAGSEAPLTALTAVLPEPSLREPSLPEPVLPAPILSGPIATDPAPLPVPVPMPEPTARQADRMLPAPQVHRPSRRLRAAVLASWAFSFVILAAAAWAVLTWRSPLMRAWPASSRIYAALGYLNAAPSQ